MASSNHEDEEGIHSFNLPDSDLPPLPTDDEDSYLEQQSDAGRSEFHSEGSALMEKEMRRRLADLESSFVPDPEAGGDATARLGLDDTYIFGGSTASKAPEAANTNNQEATNDKSGIYIDQSSQLEAPTPADAYKTPGVKSLSLGLSNDQNAGDTPAPETSGTDQMPSSPTDEVARRTRSRVASRAASRSQSRAPSISISRAPSRSVSRAGRSASRSASVERMREASQASEAREAYGQEEKETSNIGKRAVSLAPPNMNEDVVPEEDSSSMTEGNSGFSMAEISGVPTLSNVASAVSSIRVNKRPSYLRNRQGSQRSSLSSFTNRSDVSLEGNTDTTTLGADYALQSGGAAPTLNTRPSFGLSRLPSLGSIASSMSGFDESNPSAEQSRVVSGIGVGANGRNLTPLHEERHERHERPGTAKTATPPQTPRAPSLPAPTDTVIAQHVRNIQVPDTAAKEYREKHLRSPDKRSSTMTATPFTASKAKHNLTLKEQNSKIDKLTKENFDLKLKIYYLDEALKSRSDEGVKEMIEKNVQLQTDLANEKKDNMHLRKKVRDLEKRLKAQEEDFTTSRPTTAGSDGAKSTDSERYLEMEEEIAYLRECLEHTESQLDKLREEGLAKEKEKRRMAEYIKAMSDRSAQEPQSGIEEAMEMWKDLLQAETARREQADEDAQRLREELDKLKTERAVERAEAAAAAAAAHNNSTNNVRNVYNISKRQQTTYSTRSQSGSDVVDSQNGAFSNTSTLVEQLRHENAELRRDLGAQTSMLTSRNRERERLQQEIEDLKLTARRGEGGRSVAGDSIFERSVSRAHQRSASRASGHTRATQISDAEREDYESKQAALRDEIAQTKLLNQDLERELNAHLDILTQTEEENRALKEEKQLAVEDLQALQLERDEVLEALQDKENECESLREEAIQTIERLEDEIAQKEQELDRLANDLDNRNEDFAALQQEMKSVGEALIQLEDEKVSNLRKIQSLEQDLTDANLELEALEKRLREALSKIERLEVQLESTQDEISFLREEQEADKIKIGELEAALSTAQTNIQDEKERYRDLEDRFAEERRQREILGDQEKEHVQKVLDDLNLQLSKSKEEVRKLRKNLSTKEVEATSSRERLNDLETGLREALGTLDGTKSNFVKEITKLQKDLDSTVQELENARHELAEKDRLLRNRDSLLESTGLESRRLSELLEKERLARKQDKIQIEHHQRTHQSVTRTIQQHETRVVELESGRAQDRKKLAQLEQQYRDQLLDRNNLLLALWNRLSTICGADWAQKHALIGHELPSLEVIGRNLAGFNKNIILAVKHIENIVGGFRSRVRTIEKDLLKDYQTLEHTLDVRVKRLEQLERKVMQQLASGPARPSNTRSNTKDGSSSPDPEVVRLRTENKHLRAELQFSKQQLREESNIPYPNTPGGAARGTEGGNRNSVASTLLRHHSTSAVEMLQQQQKQQQGGQPAGSIANSSGATNGSIGVGVSAGVSASGAGREYTAATLQPSEQRWIHRLKELEKRLKAEREARLLDRSGARTLLQEGRAENEELRRQLERERERNIADGGSVTGEK